MRYLVHVAVFDNVDHLAKKLSSFVFCKRTHFRQSLEQLSSFTKTKLIQIVLSDYVEIFFVFEGLVNLDDLRVVEGREDDEFFENVSWVFDVFLFDAFDSPDRMGVVLHLPSVDDSKRTVTYHLI